MTATRRRLLLSLAAAAGVPLFARAEPPASPRRGRVVVVGAGFGGATAAKYLRLWSPGLEVVAVEPREAFVSCPGSNLVLAGSKSLSDLTTAYSSLEERYGVTWVRDEAVAIDPERRVVRLKRGDPVPYDRVIVAPGIDFAFDEVEGLAADDARERVPHAWKAGPQTAALRRRIESIRDGGIFVVTIPRAPYRCPPGPYERASLVADYFKRAKPRSKVIVLDANPEIVSKKALFSAAWAELYPDHLEYRPNSTLLGVDARTLTARLEVEDVKADVLNVIPPQRAGAVAAASGLVTTDRRWCAVDFLTFESKAAPGVHVLGDAILAAPAMPKSAFMANGHAKVAADAVAALIAGEPVNPLPALANTCYSHVSENAVVHVASVHKYDKEKSTFLAVQGAGGVSVARNEAEAAYAAAWFRNIVADALL